MSYLLDLFGHQSPPLGPLIYIALSHQENKIAELKFIQCPIKVSFQGQRNPQSSKNPGKISSFKAWDF